MPKSFKKDSMKKYFPLNFHLIHEYDLPNNSFLIDNKCYDVQCVFQIWEKKQEKRKETIKLFPNNFIFVKKNENPDISFRRVGVYAGKITKDYNNNSDQSHYFIKFLKKYSNELLKELEKIDFNCKNDTT